MQLLVVMMWIYPIYIINKLYIIYIYYILYILNKSIYLYIPYILYIYILYIYICLTYIYIYIYMYIIYIINIYIYMYINSQKVSNKIKVIISMISKSFHIFGYLTSFLYILGFVKEIALTQV